MTETSDLDTFTGRKQYTSQPVRMETVNNVAAAASKAIWGESTTTTTEGNSKYILEDILSQWISIIALSHFTFSLQ